MPDTPIDSARPADTPAIGDPTETAGEGFASGGGAPYLSGADWWRSAVVYQIYPKSFADGNGDGIGDLIGVRNRLDHLQQLGVDGIWLSPFYTSPMADGGYDVADPTDVDPMFGTLADFDALVTAAHARDIKVTVDIVPNHFSDQHPWFAAGAGRRPRLAGAGPVHLPRRQGPGRRPSRPTTGRPCSAVRPGTGCPTASGTCTSSPPSSRT